MILAYVPRNNNPYPELFISKRLNNFPLKLKVIKMFQCLRKSWNFTGSQGLSLKPL